MSNVVFGDRAQETTTTQGTGTYSLAGAAAGKQSLVDAVKEITGDLVGPWVVEYFVADNVDWEVGVGTLTDATPDTLARTAIIDSSNAGSAVNWGAGTRNVVLAPGSRRLMSLPGMAAETELTIAAGAIAPRFGMHRVDTEADAASDDLDTIGQTYLQDGAWLLLGAADTARVVTVRHNQGTTGKILTADSANVALNATTKYLLLQRVGTTWVERARFGFERDAFKVSAKTGAYTLTALDRSRTIDATSGTWTLTLLAAATAGNGFFFALRNSGTGVITIDGDGVESIDGEATITALPGESLLLVCNGTAWKTVGRSLGGAIAFSGELTPAQITANQNDYNPTGLASVSMLRLSSDASRIITGLQGGWKGRFLTVHNVGLQNIVLADESASSSAANRFALTGDLTLSPDQMVELQYDATSSRWRAAGSGGMVAATQAEMEAAASNAVAVTPGRVQYHPGVAKAWVYITTLGGTVTVAASHNVSSVTDNAAGDFTTNFTTAFSSASYAWVGMARRDAGQTNHHIINTKGDTGPTASAHRWQTTINSISLNDPPGACVAYFGDQ